MPSYKIMPGKLEHKFDCKYWQSFIKNYKKAPPRNYKTLFLVVIESNDFYTFTENIFRFAANVISVKTKLSLD